MTDNNNDDFLDSLLQSVDDSEISKSSMDISEIDDILNSMSDKSNVDGENLTDVDKLMESDIKTKKSKRKKTKEKKVKEKKAKEKRVKEKKLWSKGKKNKDTDSNELDLKDEASKILSETGSTAEDMEGFKFDESTLFKELDDLDSIGEKQPKKKKEKKAKKVKKSKKNKNVDKDGRIEIKKTKPVVPAERIYISPITYPVVITFIAVIVLVVFFGGNLNSGKVV